MNDLIKQLSFLKLSYSLEYYEAVAKTAAQKKWTHIQYFSELIEQEANLRNDKLIERRIRSVKVPCHKNPGSV